MASAPVHGDDRRRFEAELAGLQGELASTGATGIWDAQVRLNYQRNIVRAADDLRKLAQRGELSWQAAAEQAHSLRDATRQAMRGRSSPLGRALAQFLESEGPTLNALVAKYTVKLHGAAADFNRLTQADREAVYAAIVSAAGRANPAVNLWLRRASRLGRGLIFLSIAISVYTVATSADPAAAARKEAAVTGAGILGGAAAGALAGLACGPGAPVCVGIGAFVGGAAAALGVDYFW